MTIFMYLLPWKQVWQKGLPKRAEMWRDCGIAALNNLPYHSIKLLKYFHLLPEVRIEFMSVVIDNQFYETVSRGQHTLANMKYHTDLLQGWAKWCKFSVTVLIAARSCCGSVDKTMDSHPWGPRFESAGSGSSALGQSTLSSLSSPLERT